MTAGRVTTWSQRFLGTAALLLVAWQVAALAGLGRRVGVLLGVYGFVLHAVFGKAYSLVPAYFDRQLAIPEAPAVQFPLSVTGVVAMATGVALGVDWLRSAGSMLWLVGVLAFVGTLTWTVRTNPTGAETGTGETSADRARVDRVANAGMPVAVAYLAAGAYATAAAYGPLPSVLGAYPARASHLVAAGAAALLLFAVGFRLLPRFLVATQPRWLALVVLPAGALGPMLLAVGYPAGPLFVAGAVLEATAVAAFAAAYGWLFRSTDRDRIGFFGPLFGVGAGLAGVGFGLWFALVGLDPSLAMAHLRVNLFGLLGLSILGVLFQFYPPGVAAWRAAGDRLALGGLAVGFLGVVLFGLEPFGGWPLDLAGHGAMLAAGVIALYCVGGAIRTQTAGR